VKNPAKLAMILKSAGLAHDSSLPGRFENVTGNPHNRQTSTTGDLYNVRVV
jgi:hypothetical protein